MKNIIYIVAFLFCFVSSAQISSDSSVVGMHKRGEGLYLVGSGSGDFKADGSVPATGDFNMDNNNIDSLNVLQFLPDIGSGTGNLYMSNTNQWYFTRAGTSLGGVFDLSNLTLSRVFNLPNASGTFALTSDLTSFLESGDNISELTNDSGYITSQTDDQNASEVPFTPYLTITSTNTQAAIQELKDEVDAGSGTDDQTASEVPITDSGNNYTGTEVETALSEIADSLAVKVNINPNSSPVEVFRGTYAEAQAEYGSDPNTWPEKLFGIIPDYPETAISLDDLSDVTKGSVATNSSGTLRVLADPNEDGNYNEIDWTPTGGGGATQLSELSDVNTSTPTNRNVLVGDGVDFESRPLVEADISDLGSYAGLGVTNSFTGNNDFTAGITSNNVLVDGNQGVTIIPPTNTNAGAVRYQTPVSPINKISPSNDQGITWFNTDGSFNIGHTDNTSFNRTIAFDFSGLGLTKRTLTIPDASGTIALTSDLGGSVPDDTGSTNGDVLTTDGAGTYTWETLTAPNPANSTTIDLSSVLGNRYVASANGGTTYTTTGAISGGWAKILINATSQPTVTGGTLITGSNFQTSTNMYLIIYTDNGTDVEYYFIEI